MLLPDQILVKMSGLAFGGSCVGLVVDGKQDALGKKCFIPFTIPGELVVAKITKDGGSFFEANLVKILETSRDRIEPRCPIFSECGGCQLQHMELALQREEKKRMVEQTLNAQAEIKPQEPIVFLGETFSGWNYRKRVIFHASKEGVVGFYQPLSRRLIEVQHCHITSPAINRSLKEIKLIIQDTCPHIYDIIVEEQGGEVNVVFKVRPAKKINREQIHDLFLRFVKSPPFNFSVIYGNDNIVSALADSLQKRTVGHFSQVNHEANALLVETVCQQLSGVDILELFAGSGNFTLPLAQTGKQVTAVECDKALVKYGQEKAIELEVSDRVTFVRKSYEKYIRKYPLKRDILIDPPRSGAIELVRMLNSENTNQLVYVSCHLPTLTRDLKILQENGLYLRRIFLLDMFPQTHHIETISVVEPIQ
ncbi:MAG TPA: rRNA adenine N-6-methyltransferase family protein [Oligoflexia bacterium]|nr:rRNA adenine N-6-methyltransferase family protein [Oligoflexia bacterium]HMP26788.1 rRNA adenine N-6-methyltransferase family protein [Oligoflexia bacterium]